METIPESKRPRDDMSIDSFLPYQVQYKRRMDGHLRQLVSGFHNSDFARLVRSTLFPGRRLRPFLFYWLLDNDHRSLHSTQANDVDCYAIAVELAHRSSIILDDIIDADTNRRHVPTVHHEYGSDLTILMSHYLVAEAFKCILNLQPPVRLLVVEDLTRTHQNMCLGELADIGTHPLRERDYISLYTDTTLLKTSSLFELVYTGVARFLGLSSTEIGQFANLGRAVGELYQINNDIYDETKASFDARGSRESAKVTLSLPNAYTLDHGQPQNQHFLRTHLGLFCTSATYEVFKRESHDAAMQLYCDKLSEAKSREVRDRVDTISRPDIKAKTIAFIDWLTADKCWDHKFYEESGY